MLDKDRFVSIQRFAFERWTKGNAVERIEILSFGEPVDYIPGGKWYAQFTGKKLGPEPAPAPTMNPDQPD